MTKLRTILLVLVLTLGGFSIAGAPPARIGCEACERYAVCDVGGQPAIIEGGAFLFNDQAASTFTCIPAEDCCRICRKGKACGDSCISRSYTCSKGRGCACNANEVCKD